MGGRRSSLLRNSTNISTLSSMATCKVDSESPSLESVIISRFSVDTETTELRAFNDVGEIDGQISMFYVRRACYYVSMFSTWFYELRRYSLLLSINRPFRNLLIRCSLVTATRHFDSLIEILASSVVVLRVVFIFIDINIFYLMSIINTLK